MNTDLVEQPKDSIDPSIGAAAQLPTGLAVMKMENDSIMAMAASRPRDHRAMLAELRNQLQTYKSFAEGAIYSKPVGKDRDGKMKYARGLSIRAAESLAEVYGYNRIRTDIEPVDEDTVKVTATFTDFQRGRIWSDSRLLSKWYTAHGGGRRRHSDDRFYNVVVGAECSRRIRECVIRSIPPGLRAEILEIADEQLDAFLDDSTTQKIVAQFSTKDVTEQQLENMLEKRRESWTKDDRKLLLATWTAIEEGEATVHELFGDHEAQEAPSTLAGRIKKKAEATRTKPPTKTASVEPEMTEADGDAAMLDKLREQTSADIKKLNLEQRGKLFKNCKINPGAWQSAIVAMSIEDVRSVRDSMIGL